MWYETNRDIAVGEEILLDGRCQTFDHLQNYRDSLSGSNLFDKNGRILHENSSNDNEDMHPEHKGTFIEINTFLFTSITTL